jgi:hypothetical protein
MITKDDVDDIENDDDIDGEICYQLEKIFGGDVYCLDYDEIIN